MDELWRRFMSVGCVGVVIITTFPFVLTVLILVLLNGRQRTEKFFGRSAIRIVASLFIDVDCINNVRLSDSHFPISWHLFDDSMFEIALM